MPGITARKALKSPIRMAGPKNYSKTISMIQTILVSVKFLSAILGPEMAAPILWAPGKMRSFCRKTHVHKIPPFRRGCFGFLGGGSADFMGVRIFLKTISMM